ncbi:gluconokinase [Candidatus Nitrospira neomarina]|uniref:Gluconokinase n=1 Tax=Candidatus Nitrospira neomarina TaxID=3020899 RepID=A0AA96GKX3_9BACT|nr:gluconokinase [Candidatus Nitrospira neomarina]WNM60199.1 gluconokinase [Candidatus Nitrospira neomarina]
MREAKNRDIWIVILMGVSGSGKTTIGQLLARNLGWSFYEGDDFHSARNVSKLQGGIPLSEEDRLPWLFAIHQLVHDLISQSQRAVITCSALKQAYRKLITEGRPQVSLVYLRGNYALIHPRLQSRTGHFMKADLLASQFTALEEPHDVPFIDVSQPPEVIAEQIKRMLHLQPA